MSVSVGAGEANCSELFLLELLAHFNKLMEAYQVNKKGLQ